MKEKLLNVGFDLTLDKAIDIARSHEITQSQLKTIAGGNSGPCEQTVHAISWQFSKNESWKMQQDMTIETQITP